MENKIEFNGMTKEQLVKSATDNVSTGISQLKGGKLETFKRTAKVNDSEQFTINVTALKCVLGNFARYSDKAELNSLPLESNELKKHYVVVPQFRTSDSDIIKQHNIMFDNAEAKAKFYAMLFEGKNQFDITATKLMSDKGNNYIQITIEVV